MAWTSVLFTLFESAVSMYARCALDAHPPNLRTSSSVFPDANATVAAALRMAWSVYGLRIPSRACASLQTFAMNGAVIVAPSAGKTSSGCVGRSVGASRSMRLYALTGHNSAEGAAAMQASRDCVFACMFFAHFLCRMSAPPVTLMSLLVVCLVGSNDTTDRGATSDCLAPV